MTENGAKILEFIKEIRHFSKDIALLLRTVDGLMENEGWFIPIKRKAAYSNSSYGLDNADKWYPYYLFRFYTNKSYPSILVFVSILLDDDYNEEFIEYMEEPYITAGFYDFGDSEIKEAGKNWWHYYAQCYGHYNNLEEDGIIYVTKDNWLEDWEFCDFQYVKCFGLPLTSITNSNEIESEIVNHLIGLLPSEKIY